MTTGRFPISTTFVAEETYVFFGGFSVIVSSLGSRLSGRRFSGMFTFRTKQTSGYRERFDLLLDDLRFTHLAFMLDPHIFNLRLRIIDE